MAVFDDVSVDEDETRRTERRFKFDFDSSLSFLDEKEKFDSIDELDAFDDGKEEADVEDEDDEDSSTTIDLKKFQLKYSYRKITDVARRRRFSQLIDEVFFPSFPTKKKILLFKRNKSMKYLNEIDHYHHWMMLNNQVLLINFEYLYIITKKREFSLHVRFEKKRISFFNDKILLIYQILTSMIKNKSFIFIRRKKSTYLMKIHSNIKKNFISF